MIDYIHTSSTVKRKKLGNSQCGTSHARLTSKSIEFFKALIVRQKRSNDGLEILIEIAILRNLNIFLSLSSAYKDQRLYHIETGNTTLHKCRIMK